MWSTNKLKHYQDDFLIRIAELTRSGFTQYEAIEFLFSQYDGVAPGIKKECLELLRRGESLSDIISLLRYPANIILQVYFGERYGNLEDTLVQCHQFSTVKRQSLKHFMKTIQYPFILLAIFFTLILIVNQTVLPQFQNMYDSMGIEISQELQILTTLLFIMPKLLLGGSAVLVIALIMYYVLFKRAAIRRKLWLLKKVPVINSLYRKYITYRVSIELSFFLGNGIAMIKIIEIFRSQDKDLVMQHIGNVIQQALMAGQSLPEAVESVGLFEQSMINFIRHGEKNSKLDVELKYYSEYIFKKFEMQILKYIKWIQPVVFSALGLLIITLYLVIILPMLQMMSGIQ
ncbi:competence type IV pilus assembly protein ComGB [Macrococcus equipercicus]|uniref:Type II secretion system F family protein n=1 Tax=Macrococcus equipercicus TaxID=69967 RepID=A0A9Q9F0G7_9STAP|nr:competence type IV pilus assembly protein ComGB [Macrococcus equipercicus]UTH12943.1 type II secretion system F family protein [Macrococcus equipercicus]